MSGRPCDNPQPAILNNKCLILGGIGTCVFGGFAFFFVIAFSLESAFAIFGFAVFSLFSVTSLFLLIAYLNCRIWYDENIILIKDIWGRKREYKYSDITGRYEDFSETYLFFNSRKIEISSDSRLSFYNYVCNRYEELYGKRIPLKSRKEYAKRDLFKGNVKNSSAYIALFILMILLFGYIAIEIYDYAHGLDAPNTYTITFIGYKEVDGGIILLSYDNKEYSIYDLPSDYDLGQLKAICHGRTIAKVKGVFEYGENKPCTVTSIVVDNVELLPVEELLAVRKKFITGLISIAGGAFLLLILFEVLLVIVGRNPTKYPKLFDKLLKTEDRRHLG